MPRRNPGHPFILPGSLPFWKGWIPGRRKRKTRKRLFLKGREDSHSGLRGNPGTGDSPQVPLGSSPGGRARRARRLPGHRGREDSGPEGEKGADPGEVLRIPAPSRDQVRREAGKRRRRPGQGRRSSRLSCSWKRQSLGGRRSRRQSRREGIRQGERGPWPLL